MISKIITSKPTMLVREIMETEFLPIDADLDDKEVATLFERNDLISSPVVDKDSKLIGRITIDDVVDVITESAEEERQIMSGITTDVEEDDSIWKLSNARLPWLVIGILGGLFGAFFLGSFESNYFEENEVFISLSFFIPLIMATAGNVGIQSSSIVIQTLSTPSPFETVSYTHLTLTTMYTV